MDHINYFKDMLESIPNYRKTILLILLIQNDKDLMKQCGFLKSDIDRLSNDFKKFLMAQNEDCLDYFKNEEESVIEKILSK